MCLQFVSSLSLFLSSLLFLSLSKLITIILILMWYFSCFSLSSKTYFDVMSKWLCRHTHSRMRNFMCVVYDIVMIKNYEPKNRYGISAWRILKWYPGWCLAVDPICVDDITVDCVDWTFKITSSLVKWLPLLPLGTSHMPLPINMPIDSAIIKPLHNHHKLPSIIFKHTQPIYDMCHATRKLVDYTSN